MDVVKTWEHAGMACVMRRSCLGIPCGYVVLPEGHPLHGVEHADMDEWPDVHGGVTWTGVLSRCSYLGWLIGFDMGHDGDFECDPFGDIRVIRTDDECVAETNRLAEQMARWGE